MSKKVAIVTGARGRLGSAVANRLSNDYTVMGASRQPADNIYSCDVSNHADVYRLVNDTLQMYGSIDVLVCCAGFLGPTGPFTDIPWPAWQMLLTNNIQGTLLPCHTVLPIMRTQKSGSIITISGAGLGGRVDPTLGVYAATKAAIVQFTESLAAELDGTGITANSVAPGAIEVPTQLSRAVELIAWLADSPPISGRLLSATWDDWTNLPESLPEDRFKIRRVV